MVKVDLFYLLFVFVLFLSLLVLTLQLAFGLPGKQVTK
jgi:hypothetical protein